MIGIREFSRDDIPQVADLHRSVMRSAPEMTPVLFERYREWFRSIFLDNPMRVPGEGLESLVYEDQGEIIAFLGVVAREVTLGRKSFRGSCASNFCVKAERRGRLGMQIAREYLARSSDLAFIDELMDRPRQLWDHLGMLAMPQSVRWTLPLRPAQHLLSLIGYRVHRALAAAPRPAAAIFDGLATRVPRSPFRHVPPPLTEEELTDAALSTTLREFGTEEYLRPVATDGSTTWLLARARSMKQHGELHSIGLRNTLGDVVGWYVYYANDGKPSDVLQLVATPAAAPMVLSHLALHARSRGVVSLTGTLDPIFLTALADHWAVISPTPMVTRWMMVHSTRSEVLEAFWRNRVLLSRLDGEWFQHFP